MKGLTGCVGLDAELEARTMHGAAEAGLAALACSPGVRKEEDEGAEGGRGRGENGRCLGGVGREMRGVLNPVTLAAQRGS